jgi:predicted dehydrogenase
VKTVNNNTGNTPKTVQDIRQALDDRNVDVISIATPNHWHSLMTIWGCQAGKDVYVEKPCSHNIHEGRIAVEAARKHGRIVQHGTQSRSSGSWAKIIAVIKSETYGPLRVARGHCYKASGGRGTRGDIGFAKHKTPPDSLDFGLWLGPALDQDYHENLVHYRWHWFWDFGNGDLGNQGVHQMDIARWGIPGATLPKSVVCVGGRFGPKDQGQTANTQVAVYDYGETQLIFEVRGLKSKSSVTNMFHFDDGTIRADGRFYKKGSDKGEPLPNVDYSRGPGGSHFSNFIAAVRSRNAGDLNADIEEGHFSSALCHLANISYRLGKPTPFDTKTGLFAGNSAASETFAKMEQHLAKENNLKLQNVKYSLGRTLTIDSRTESFVNDDEANGLLTRNYRKPFVVPDKLA